MEYFIKNIVGRLSVMVLLCIECSCGVSEAVENRFYVDSIEMRLVDIIDVDQYGCVTLDSFKLNRDNEYCAVGLLFKKTFYLDEDTNYVKSSFMGQAPKGMMGSKSDIDFVVVEFLSRNNERINMNRAFSANANFLGVRYQSAKFDRIQEYIGQGECGAYEGFPSIDQFVKDFNDNVPSVRGEGLNSEILFFLEKNELLNKVESPLAIHIAIKFNPRSSFEHDMLLQN